MTQLQWFRLLAPEFASLSDAQVTALLTAASLFVYAPCLDADRLNAATALYAAHMALLQANSASGSSAATGQVTMEKEGDLQRSFGVSKSASNQGLLGEDIYGQQYLEMTAACFGATIMTRYGDTIPQGIEVIPSGRIF